MKHEEPGSGAGLFLSLLNGRRLRHVRRKRVDGRGWRLCFSLRSLRLVGRRSPNYLFQGGPLNLHTDVAAACEHLMAGRNTGRPRGPVSVPGNAPARTAFDGQFPQLRFELSPGGRRFACW